MNRGTTLFLKIVILLIAFIALAGMVWLPQTEGRAANLDLISIYKDPFIIYAYLASIPFFVALYQGFKLLGYVDNNKVFSQLAVKAIRNIKYCAMAIPVLIIAGDAFVILNANGDDTAGFVALSIYATFASVVFATGATVAQKLLQKAVDIKSENDLTV